MSWRYSYRRHLLSDEQLLETSNRLGEQGWRVKNLHWSTKYGGWDVFFEYIKTDREILREVFSLPARVQDAVKEQP